MKIHGLLSALIAFVLAISLGASSGAFAAANDTALVGVGNKQVETPMENAGGLAATLANAGVNQEASLAFFGQLHSSWLIPCLQISGAVVGIFMLAVLAGAAIGWKTNVGLPTIFAGLFYVAFTLWPVDGSLVTNRLAGKKVALGAALIYVASDTLETFIKSGAYQWAGKVTGGGAKIPLGLALKINPPSVRGLSNSPHVPAQMMMYQDFCALNTDDKSRRGATKEQEYAFKALTDFDKQNVGLLGWGTVGREPGDYSAQVSPFSIPGVVDRTFDTGVVDGAAKMMRESRLKARAALRTMTNGGAPINPPNIPIKVPNKKYWDRYVYEVDTLGKDPAKVKPRPTEYMTLPELAAATGIPSHELMHPDVKRAARDPMFKAANAGGSYDESGAYAYNCDQMFQLTHVTVKAYTDAYRARFTVEAADGPCRDSLTCQVSVTSATDRALASVARTNDRARNVLGTYSPIAGTSDTRKEDLSWYEKVYNFFGAADDVDPTLEDKAPSKMMQLWTWWNDFKADYFVIAIVGIFAMLVGIWFALFPVMIPMSFISMRPWDLLFKQVAAVFFLKFTLGLMFVVVVVGNLFAVTVAQAVALEPLGGMGNADDIAPLVIVATIGLPFMLLAVMALSGWLLLGSMRGISSMSDKFFGGDHVAAGYKAAAQVAVGGTLAAMGKTSVSHALASLGKGGGGGGGGKGAQAVSQASNGPIPGQEEAAPAPSQPTGSGGGAASATAQPRPVSPENRARERATAASRVPQSYDHTPGQQAPGPDFGSLGGGRRGGNS